MKIETISYHFFNDCHNQKFKQANHAIRTHRWPSWPCFLTPLIETRSIRPTVVVVVAVVVFAVFVVVFVVVVFTVVFIGVIFLVVAVFAVLFLFQM